MLAALAHFQAGLQSKSQEKAISDAKQQREQFKQHMLQDSGEVLNKLLTTLGTEMRAVLDEVNQQNHHFWTNQIHKLEESNRVSTEQLQQHLLQANEKLEETVKMYTQVIDNLNSQLAAAHSRLEQQEEAEQALVTKLQSQLGNSEATLEEASHTYKGILQDLNRQLVAAQGALRDAEVKGQQKRLVLGQTVDSQQKEIDELKLKLMQVNRELENTQVRNQKLTSVAQHLLSKHQVRKAAVGAAREQSAKTSQEQLEGTVIHELPCMSSQPIVEDSPSEMPEEFNAVEPSSELNVIKALNASPPRLGANEVATFSPSLTSDLLGLIFPSSVDELGGGLLDIERSEAESPTKVIAGMEGCADGVCPTNIDDIGGSMEGGSTNKEKDRGGNTDARGGTEEDGRGGN